ncbi:MAG: hypothetical protein WDO73_16130 [Ignavibacteriota bacterium]
MAGILGLPHTAAHRPHIERVGLIGMAGDGVTAAAAHRADIAPFQACQQAHGVLPSRRWLLCEQRNSRQSDEAQATAYNNPAAIYYH